MCAFPGALPERHPIRGQVAQLVEQGIENPRVGGSIPSLATTLFQPPISISAHELMSRDQETGRTFKKLLTDAASRLSNRLEADILLTHLLRCDRGWLYAHATDPCPPEVESAYTRLVERRAAGEPVAYITGTREFFGREFLADRRVLIPRPETELLVERALELDLPECARVLDIGTGSGCIAITLCLERPHWQVSAVDRSELALQVAARNRDCLGARSLELLHGSLFEPVKERRFDLIVSNPPYVAAGDEHLSKGDVRFEPDLALVAGTDGLDLIRQIVSEAPGHLESGGWLLLEHGHDQAAAVRSLLIAAGLGGVGSCSDLAGIERASFGQAS